MSGDNLSAVLHKIDDLRMEQRPIPKIKNDEVLISVQHVGICGSDVHYWKRGRIGDFVVKDPLVMGHEPSGIVKEVGKEVVNFKPGDRVVIEPGVGCLQCDVCKEGTYNLCPKVEFCATPPGHGTLCRYYAHKATFCHKIPDNVTLEEAALTEPLSVAVHACRRAGVAIGKSVLITGAGPIGLVNLLTAKAMGATSVCLVDIVASRLEFAKSLGADHVVLGDNRDPEALAKKVVETMGYQPDITIECSGVEMSAQLGLFATKASGVLTLIGNTVKFISIPIMEVIIREIDIRGVFRYANCHPIALSLMSSGKVNVKPLITHRFPLEDSLKAFEVAHTGAGGAIKVLIDCAKR